MLPVHVCMAGKFRVSLGHVRVEDRELTAPETRGDQSDDDGEAGQVEPKGRSRDHRKRDMVFSTDGTVENQGDRINQSTQHTCGQSVDHALRLKVSHTMRDTYTGRRPLSMSGPAARLSWEPPTPEH